jgi:CP family cyanate transporter-like MFS transporter
MTASIPVIPRGGRVVAVLGIVLAALSMRAAVAVIAPVFSIISDDLDFDVIVLSFIGAAPPLAFAAAGLVVPRLVRRFGLEPMLIVGILAITLGEGLRAFAFEPILLIGATTFAMLGIGMANVLLPPLVRRYFPERIGQLTSLYLVLMCIGAAVPAFTAVQIAEAVGWRVSIGLWAVIPLVAVIPWLVMLRAPRPADPVTAPITIEPTVVEFDDGEDEPRPAAAPVRRPVAASPTAWAITAAFALASISIYAAMAFLPSMLVAAGVAPVVGASALGVAVALGIPQALVVPLLATRRRAVTPMIVFSAFCGVVGWLGMLLAPAAAPLLWGGLIGSVPIAFPLALLLVNTRTRSHRVTVSVSGFVQSLGYVVAGVSSFGIGLLHDATGSWTAPMIVVLGSLVLAVPAIVILRRDRYVDDELSPQPPLVE